MSTNAQLVDAVYGAVSGWLERRLAPLRQRMSTLLARQDAIEQRTLQLAERGGGAMTYRELWRHDETYKRGETCTFANGLWVALRDNSDKPSAGTGAWRLALKSPQQGPQGLRGLQGDIGPMPRHRWDGTKLQFEQGPDGGKWGEAVDLRGSPGAVGVVQLGGGSSATPVNSYFPAGWG
jgi:hypothetical protein